MAQVLLGRGIAANGRKLYYQTFRSSTRGYYARIETLRGSIVGRTYGSTARIAAKRAAAKIKTMRVTAR